MGTGRFFFIVGSHGKGKTTLAKRLMQVVDLRVETWVLFGGSEGSRALADGILPPAFCRYGPVRPEDLERLIRLRQIEVDLARRNGREPRRQCVVFDDCGKSPAFRRALGCPFTKLIDDMRHLRVSVIMTSQNPSYIHPDTLSQVDFLFTLSVTMREAQKTLYDRVFRGNLGTPGGTAFATRDNQRFAAYVRRYADRPGHCLVFSQAGPTTVTHYRWPRHFDVWPLGDLAYNEKGRMLRGQRGRDPATAFDEEMRRMLERH